MATRGRRKGFKMTEEHRHKIKASNILNRLEKFVMGVDGVEMAPHAVTAALGLLRKVMPDLASIEQRIENVQPFAVLPSEIESVEVWEKENKPN